MNVFCQFPEKSKNSIFSKKNYFYGFPNLAFLLVVCNCSSKRSVALANMFSVKSGVVGTVNFPISVYIGRKRGRICELRILLPVIDAHAGVASVKISASFVVPVDIDSSGAEVFNVLRPLGPAVTTIARELSLDFLQFGFDILR